MNNNWLDQYPEAAAFFGPFLDHQDLEDILVSRFPAGSPIMEESSYDDSALYYILEGVAEGMTSSLADIENGLYYVPSKVGQGSFTGFFEATQGKPTKRRLSIYAKTDVTALKISQSLVYRWAHFKPDLLLNIFSRILVGSWKQREVVSNVNSFNSNIKLAVHLCYLYDMYLHSCYPPEYSGSVRIMDTHRELGYAVGCSIRTVDRCIARFCEEGSLSLRRGKIHMNQSQYELLLHYAETHS